MAKLKPAEKFHLSRLALFVVLGFALLIAKSGASVTALMPTRDKQVLAYATSMNRGDLLSAANASRSANGLAPLTMVNSLNNAAQMKANDMITNNYWAHVSPTGVQPWYWFNQVGYTYLAAGENLAYGFDTGAEVNTGWMNSPTHKANLLGDYTDVGFGIANGSQFQGSENTVVVAHYGKPQQAAPVTPPAPPAATTTPTPTPPAAPPAPLSQTASQPPAPAPKPPTTSDQSPVAPPEQVAAKPIETAKSEPTPSVATSEKTAPVTLLDQVKSGQAPFAVIASIGIVSVAAIGFGLSHRSFVRHLVANGKKFALHHPVLDISAIGLTIGAILSSTAGHLL